RIFHLEHAEEEARVLVAGEAEVAHLARAQRLEARLGCAARSEDPVGVVPVVHLVEHPQIEVLALEELEALVELAKGAVAVARADLRHEEDLLAPLAKDEAHAPLRFALVVLPRVVEERDALIDRAMHDPHRLVRLELRTADVAATETKDRHLFAIAAEGPSGNV